MSGAEISATGRAAIFGKVKAALGVERNDEQRQHVVQARLRAKSRHPMPARVAGKGEAELVATFAGHLRACAATVIEVPRADVPTAVARYLREANQPSRVRMGADPRLAALDWAREPTLTRRMGRAEPGDEVGLSYAVAGVAETGTLVLASGPDNPVTVTFLPEAHVVLVDRRQIVAGYEDALALVGARAKGEGLPRTVNFVSGASRTGDIGGRIVMGAHGPRALAVVIVDD